MDFDAPSSRGDDEVPLIKAFKAREPSSKPSDICECRFKVINRDEIGDHGAKG